MAKTKKVATLSSLNRIAARGESEYLETTQSLFDESVHERTAEFFTNMNIPRSVTSDLIHNDIVDLKVSSTMIGNFEEEFAISKGIQKFMDRHQRKLKWHIGHPDLELSSNVLMIIRCSIVTTSARLQRLLFLLQVKDALTPNEWAIARDIINRSFMSYRNHLKLLSMQWIEVIKETFTQDEIADLLGSFYEYIDQELRVLDEMRDAIEARRQELTVHPEGFSPVTPPVYFGGDVLSPGPWTQYWAAVEQTAHQFRESAF